MKKLFVSAIVPIFNEEQTLAKVLKTLLENSLIDEVICVNDGSTDGSLEVLETFKNRIRIINLRKNSGKGFALTQGIKGAKGNILVFIDADLTTLTGKHLESLINPVLKKEARVVLGYPTQNEYMPSVFYKLTGERVYYKKDLIPHLARMSETKYGIEIFLNSLFNEKEVKIIPLNRLKGLLKYEKRDSSNAMKEYLREASEIAKEIGRLEGLLPEDKRVIDTFTKATNFNELKKKVAKLYNRSVKQFLEKYVLKYMRNDIFKA